jgi:hypothetical protein
MAVMHVYAQEIGLGSTVPAHLAQLLVHLAACESCSEDFNGLLAAIAQFPILQANDPQ